MRNCGNSRSRIDGDDGARWPAFAARLLGVLLSLALPAAAAHLGGKVTFRRAPLPDAVVRAYQIDASSKVRAMVVATRTGADGSYRFPDLPHGQYILIVEKYGKRLYQGKAFVQADVEKNIDLGG
jgi:hypothetical protein